MSYLSIAVGGRKGFMPLPGELARNETQTASTRIGPTRYLRYYANAADHYKSFLFLQDSHITGLVPQLSIFVKLNETS